MPWCLKRPLVLIACLVVGCSSDANSASNDDVRIEGTQPNDCTDGADNDADGMFDCDDDGCTGAPACSDSNSMPDAGGDDNPDSGSSGFESAEQALDRFVELSCEKALECCNATTYEQIYLGELPADQASCESDSELRSAANSWAAWVAEGRLQIDLEVAASCFEAFAAASCAQVPAEHYLLPNLAQCDGLLVGTVEEGADCDSLRQCADGLYCTKTGSCQPRLAEGEECGTDARDGTCDEGTYCFLTCEPRKATGESCESYVECETGHCSEEGAPGTCIDWCR